MKTQSYIGMLCLFLWSVSAASHQSNDAYMELVEATVWTESSSQTGITFDGIWLISLTDLNIVLKLDQNNDGTLTWQELSSQQATIFDYFKSNVSFSDPLSATEIEGANAAENSGAGAERAEYARAASIVGADKKACGPVTKTLMMDSRNDVPYAAVGFTTSCPPSFTLAYTAIMQEDSQHRLLVTLKTEAKSDSYIFNATNGNQLIKTPNGMWHNIGVFFVQGIIHILIGYDHILFLLALIIPCVVSYQSAQKQSSLPSYTGRLFKAGYASRSDRRALATTLIKIVTAFTVAHSITLFLAAQQMVDLPISIVETIIAISVLVAGFNLIIPLYRDGYWLIAFAFGLIHGFGFASVLGEVGLPSDDLVASLLSFNVGVEAGQLAILLLVLPLFLLICRVEWRSQVFRFMAGIGIVTMGALWTVSRSADVMGYFRTI